MGQVSGTNAFALAVVVFVNWIIAHLATEWTMPPEVQSAVQTIVTIVTSYWVAKAQQRQENRLKMMELKTTDVQHQPQA